nr:MAG TPA: hypothetical protein [Caudoviricetes sp.]
MFRSSIKSARSVSSVVNNFTRTNEFFVIMSWSYIVLPPFYFTSYITR